MDIHLGFTNIEFDLIFPRKMRLACQGKVLEVLLLDLMEAIFVVFRLCE
jgi:hypothetical protein